MNPMEFSVHDLPNIGTARMNVYSRVTTSYVNSLDTG